MSATPETKAKGRKILIVDDHPVLRRGLAALIESEADLTVCGEASSGEAALAEIEATQPDLVTVDIALDGSNGLDLVKAMKKRWPTIPALVLSLYDELVYAERSLRAGALGYITKKQLDETLLIAIHEVLDGKTYMSDQFRACLADKFMAGGTLDSDSPLEALSDRELQVFQQVGEGRTTRQIAKMLSLSIKTIESHLEHIKQKLSLGSAAELAQRAAQWTDNQS